LISYLLLSFFLSFLSLIFGAGSYNNKKIICPVAIKTWISAYTIFWTFVPFPALYAIKKIQRGHETPFLFRKKHV
jgi:hypothetical protein